MPNKLIILLLVIAFIIGTCFGSMLMINSDMRVHKTELAEKFNADSIWIIPAAELSVMELYDVDVNPYMHDGCELSYRTSYREIYEIRMEINVENCIQLPIPSKIKIQ